MVKGSRRRRDFFEGFEDALTEKHFETWENILSYYSRQDIDGKRYINTASNKNGLLTIDYMKRLNDNTITNIQTAMEVYGHGYINTDTPIRDKKGGISFDGFSFTLDSMAEDMDRRGMYVPIVVGSKLDDGFLTVLGGRHRVIAIEELRKRGLWMDKEVLYLDYDSYESSFIIPFVVPNIVLDLFFKEYHIKVERVDGLFSTILIDNIADLWIFMKLQEKELDLIVEKYADEMLANGIMPADFIVRTVKGGE